MSLFWSKRKKQISFAYGKYSIATMVGILIVSGSIYVFGYLNVGQSQTWANVFDPSFTVFSFAFPIFLGIYLLGKEWENSLDNKLIVHFTLKEGNAKKYVMSCYNVNLLPNGDMRQLGQQIGQQMSKVKFLNFNPSIVPLNVGIERVTGINNHYQWIKYYEIEFLLNSEPDEFSKKPIENQYIVWNLFEEDKLVKVFEQRPSAPFDKVFNENISLQDLLSDSQEARNKYDSIEPQPIHKGELYLLNSSIITSFGQYDYQQMGIEEVKKLLATYPKAPISAIGHHSTAEVFSEMIGQKINVNRVSIQMGVGDTAIIFKLKNRLEENKVLTKEEMATLEYEFGILKRVA